jgi:hypothetical protein
MKRSKRWQVKQERGGMVSEPVLARQWTSPRPELLVASIGGALGTDLERKRLNIRVPVGEALEDGGDGVAGAVDWGNRSKDDGQVTREMGGILR